MSKPPAFPLYAGDFLSDANQMAMTLAEAGAYIRLMCVCWKEGSIPDDPRTLWKLAQAQSLRTFERVWPNVRVCFEEQDGRLVHPRIEQERRKKDTYRQKMSEAGKKGAAKRYEKTAQTKDEPNQAIATLKPGHGIRDEKEKENEVEEQLEKDAFQDFWKEYPKRAGGNPKKPAFTRWRNAVKHDDFATVLDGVKRYAAYCLATDKTGTEYVMQATTFLGDREGWTEDWIVTESDRAKVEEVHPSVEFNRKWKAREEALEAEDAGALEPVGGLTAEIMRRISA